MTDAPELLLANHLKTLRLPTFQREHDKLARICAAQGVDHVRYLARLTELELIDRERRMVERRSNRPSSQPSKAWTVSTSRQSRR
ncbi:IS21 family transposase [Roseobacter sp. GAI101]|nr:IS21 family transposase [Roseobacter sp. GAI101]